MVHVPSWGTGAGSNNQQLDTHTQTQKQTRPRKRRRHEGKRNTEDSGRYTEGANMECTNIEKSREVGNVEDRNVGMYTVIQ